MWQRLLVLQAKNVPVWLYQLSRKYSRSINTLDQIPTEELLEINSLGVTGLWLVGIWRRSPASRKIKELYGHTHLIGSAYSVNEYQVDASLGGESAIQNLKERASQAGILIACDMVPNHTGVDSDWVLDHPDWYIGTFEKPVSAWEYNSDNLSPRTGIQIRIEDGYYTQQEAAEAFQYTTSAGFGPLYIYHGNDGTSMPWNDTAQLDYLNPLVRQAVKDQILEVAKRFPIVRLDAAMTLIRRHYKRLWYPDPGGKNFIPTRDAFPMTQAEFDARMPREFWAEVMEDLKQAAPDTLMMAEAFWLMEEYFIRNLGMHRVYNSAFLNQLRDEENVQLRVYFKEILAHDPGRLECFVNYLTTPDESPAVEAFGKGAKYFGVCGLLAALPGLPMFGHGQFDGLCERYRMDFSAPMQDENTDIEFLEKSRRLITPLLRERARFVSSEKMAIYDLKKDNSTIDENVYAFSILANGCKSLVIFNNNQSQTTGVLRDTSFLTSSETKNHPANLIKALELEDDCLVTLREMRTAETRQTRSKDLQAEGLRVSLAPYQLFVFDVE